jgi:MYXO-CTERM domain-containing protein
VNSAPKLAFAVALFLGTSALSSNAHATPDFPPQIEKCLGLEAGTLAMVEPPTGCELCHVSSQGSGPLRDFGVLMQANGAMPLQASSTACKALMAIEASDPQLITALESGMDPNSISANVGPRYGCDVAPAAASGSVGAMLLAILGLGLARRQRTAL